MATTPAQPELESEIDKNVKDILDRVQILESLVNQQLDQIQRHVDQALIHQITRDLNEIETNRWDRRFGV